MLPFRVLSVITSDPLRLPEAVGIKLTGSVQDFSIGNVPAEPAELAIKFNVAFPRFHKVTVCGLLLLV